MKKRFKFFTANIAGAKIGFVNFPVYPGYRKAYSDSIKEQIDGEVDEIGFISPAYEGAPLRLDMMGDEFSDIATSAYGYHSFSFYDNIGPVEIEVYVSGKDGVVNVICDKEDSTAYTEIKLKNTYNLEVKGEEILLYDFGGTMHTILDTSKFSRNDLEEVFATIKENYREKSYGISLYDREKDILDTYEYITSFKYILKKTVSGVAAVSKLNYLGKNFNENFEEEVKFVDGSIVVISDEVSGERKILSGGRVQIFDEQTITIDIDKDIVKEITAANKEYIKKYNEELEIKKKEAIKDKRRIENRMLDFIEVNEKVPEDVLEEYFSLSKEFDFSSLDLEFEGYDEHIDEIVREELYGILRAYKDGKY